MRRDHKLRDFGASERIQDAEKGELALGRQRCFRLVQEVETILEAVPKERKEGFTMRHLVKRLSSIGSELAAGGLKVRGEIEESLSAQEEAGGHLLTPRKGECPAEGVAIAFFGKLMITITAGHIKPDRPGKSLEQAGLSRAVLTDKEGHWSREFQREWWLEER